MPAEVARSLISGDRLGAVEQRHGTHHDPGGAESALERAVSCEGRGDSVVLIFVDALEGDDLSAFDLLQRGLA